MNAKEIDITNVQFNKVYSEFLKKHGPDTAVLIAFLASKQNLFRGKGRTNEAGYFYLEHKVITESTCISEHRQKKSMERLVELELLKIDPEKKGTPPRKFYKVDTMKYEKLVVELEKAKPKHRKRLI